MRSMKNVLILVVSVALVAATTAGYGGRFSSRFRGSSGNVGLARAQSETTAHFSEQLSQGVNRQSSAVSTRPHTLDGSSLTQDLPKINSGGNKVFPQPQKLTIDKSQLHLPILNKPLKPDNDHNHHGFHVHIHPSIEGDTDEPVIMPEPDVNPNTMVRKIRKAVTKIFNVYGSSQQGNWFMAQMECKISKGKPRTCRVIKYKEL